MIVALAGRRIDKEAAETPRFPLKNIQAVREKLEALFREKEAAAVVCSAACGADLLALEAAGKLGLRRRMILPSEPEKFRAGSVTDRPGDWGEMFDRIHRELLESGDVVVMQSDAKNDELYLEANRKILDEAAALAAAKADESKTSAPPENQPDKVLAVIVWEGASRGEDDITADFANQGKRRGFETVEILTTRG